MNRVVVFAHYDKDDIVDDYVIYYLKALKKIASDIIFVSCNPILNKEKLNGIATKIIDEKHDEYDFGSYKRGFLYIRDNLNDYDELIFANDSCYGPFYHLSQMFDEMKNRECDFWGVTKNKFGMEKVGEKYYSVRRPHLQSYFLVFKKNVLGSEVFQNHILSVEHEEQKNDIIINYEISFTEKLTQAGFKSDEYIKNYYRFNHVIACFWKPLIGKYKMPFVKCSILRGANNNLTSNKNWQKFIKKCSDYPIELIEQNLERTIINSNNNIPEWIFYLIAFMPPKIKRLLYKIISQWQT